MVIDRAIVSTDNNPLYYEFWPLAAKGWRNMKIEPTVAVIGDLNLDYSFGTIIKLPLIEGIPSGFIAQVIRLIIPCLFPEEVSIIGDIDMIPLNRDYFTKHISKHENESILIFSSDAYKTELRYPMCYIAAKGKYFQEIIGLKNTELTTIESFILKLYLLNQFWDTDELFFAKQLHLSILLNKTIFLKRGGWRPFAKRRIDRGSWQYYKLGLFQNKYIDAHCLRPLNTNIKKLRDVIDFIEQGSDSKRYFYYLQKKPLKTIYNYLNLLKQNLFDKGLFNISEEITLKVSKNKIISFSLYGNNQRYIVDLDKIIHSYNQQLPDWKCRIYVAKDVNKRSIKELIDLGCEVIIMQKKGIDARYMNWRFLAIEDKEADAVIIRDIDSFCTPREKLMVDQWLNSEKKFHIIRDHVNHNAPIMGGLWGIKKNDIDIKMQAKKFLMIDKYGSDQDFLKQMIYPLIKHDVMVHDSFPRFPDENPIVIPMDLDEGFIGEISTDEKSNQNDRIYINSYHAKCVTIK